MYAISYEILIDGHRLRILDSVEITSDTANLTDTAVIRLPAMVFNKYLNNVESIRRGQSVSISFGYDGDLRQEFTGYVSSVERDSSGLVVNCQDGVYLFSLAPVKDKKYDNPSVKTLLEAVLKTAAPDLKLDCKYDFSFDSFTVQNATALDVLKTIQNECRCMMYIKDGVFNVTPPFITPESTQTVKYDTSKNIMSEGFSLKYKDKADRKLKVTAKGKDKNGKEIESKSVGESGGDTVTFNYKGIATEKMLNSIAENIYNAKSYSGYDGSFQAWFLPVVRKGDTADISDSSDPDRNGKYFVQAVKTACSSGGITRKITIGKRL